MEKKPVQKNKAAGGRKVKFGGRQKGSANVRSGHLRNETLSGRITEGCQKTIEHLKETAGYSTRMDVIHDAVLLLGNKKLTTKEHRYWLTQIQ